MLKKCREVIKVNFFLCVDGHGKRVIYMNGQNSKATYNEGLIYIYYYWLLLLHL